MSWARLIRFVDVNGKEHYGDACIEKDIELQEKLADNDLYAFKLEGKPPFDQPTKGDRVQVKALRDILKPEEVPIIRCIGLNYIKHIQEGGRKPPPYPSVFVKPSTSIAGFAEDIPIPKIAQDGTLDYEGELVAIVIGKKGKNIPESSALECVAGYCVANDVSARGWQRDLAKAGGVPQWCFSKGFDKFAPLGPMLVLVSPAVVGLANDLLLQTFVNGEERQNTSTGDLPTLWR
ncbi:fumarylacetoacetate hydrolase [Annulohypoxylon bovei var. microspora]|nr:fumarylacetoacetate hydrolase [Annulohypoxylon bovei var. microspora]